MKNIYFDFNGNVYSGHLLNDPASDPSYCWFVFNEEEMVERFGDSIAFHIANHQLIPVYEYTTQADFVEYLKKKVEAVVLKTYSKKQYDNK